MPHDASTQTPKPAPSPAASARNDCERAYLRGQRDALANRRPVSPWRDRTLCALYAAGYEAYSPRC